MLTPQEYENFKKKLSEAEKRLVSIEARKSQIIEQLKDQYQMTPDEAQTEVQRLDQLLPQKEAEFEKMFSEFQTKWGGLLGAD